MENNGAGSDEFRLMEKRIKNYGRDVMANLSKQSKRQKLKASACRNEHENNFHWNEVLDVRSNQELRATSAKCGSSTSTGLSSMSDVEGYEAYDLSHISPGLFVVSQALSVVQQVYWAKVAVEEYSKVEHNNLNNLQSLYGVDGAVADETAKDNADSKGSTTPVTCSETKEQPSDRVGKTCTDIPSVEDLWNTSREESVPFQTFSKLRWSCLGYHYG